MTDATSQERHPTDEPEGTTAHQASLRAPGESVSPGGVDEDRPADAVDDGSAADVSATDDGYGTTDLPAAHYDVGAVSGDTDAYRPD